MKLAQFLIKSETCNLRFGIFIFLTTQATFDFPGFYASCSGLAVTVHLNSNYQNSFCYAGL